MKLAEKQSGITVHLKKPLTAYAQFPIYTINEEAFPVVESLA